MQWIDRGDGLLAADGRFDARRLALVRELHPTVLRYPGGSNTDTYHWEAGRGPLKGRGTSEHFHTKEAQTVLFGTGEFLTLCRELGAEPLISVNTASGTPQEAAAWLAAIERGEFKDHAGATLGPVRWWEIGNEPYLREDVRPELGTEPAESARRIDATIAALRAVKADVQIGIPLRNETLGTVASVRYPGYAETVLADVEQRFDFVALHDTYMPFLFDGPRDASPAELFAATMAASRVVEADLQTTRGLLARTRPGQRIPFAITEVNALFTVQSTHDEGLAGMAGVLFVADTLALFAQSDDVLMANYWSLSGNWLFGALAQDGRPRPAYHMLAAYARALRGDLLATRVTAPGFDSEAVGVVPAYTGTPLITATATREGEVLRLVLLNKDWSREAKLSLGIDGAEGAAATQAVAKATASTLSGNDPFDADDPRALAGLEPLDVRGAAFPLALSLPPRSLTLVEIELKAP